MNKFIGKKVIIRADRAGVFFGELVEKDGTEVELKNARRLWYWIGANSISDLAIKGSSLKQKCKFTKSVESIIITGVIEIIPCTDEAIENIESVKEWTC